MLTIRRNDWEPRLWLNTQKDFLDKAGHWDERLSLNNDFDFSTRLLVASKGVKFARGSSSFL